MKKLSITVVTMAIALMSLTSCANNSTENVQTTATETTETTTNAPTSDTDLDYMVTLGLMKGHLIVAKELLAAGKAKEAEPHIGHPVEELYADIEAELSKRNVKEFKSSLNQLHNLVKSAPKDPKLNTEYDAAVAAVDRAIAAIPETQRQSYQFILEVINGLLATAGAEYGEAIADNKFVEVIEYQDSRGFVLYADQLYQSIADPMSKSHSQAHETIVSNLTTIKAAYPSVMPPEKPVKTVTELEESIGVVKGLNLSMN